MEEQTANGQCPSSWGLHLLDQGLILKNMELTWHIVDIQILQHIRSVNNPAPNKAYAKFLTRADNFRSLVRLNMTSVAKTYD